MCAGWFRYCFAVPVASDGRSGDAALILWTTSRDWKPEPSVALKFILFFGLGFETHRYVQAIRNKQVEVGELGRRFIGLTSWLHAFLMVLVFLLHWYDFGIYQDYSIICRNDVGSRTDPFGGGVGENGVVFPRRLVGHCVCFALPCCHMAFA